MIEASTTNLSARSYSPFAPSYNVVVFQQRGTGLPDGGAVGRRILDHLERRGWSLGMLAAKSGLNKGYLSQLTRGHVKNPGTATLGKIADALRVSLSEVTGERAMPRRHTQVIGGAASVPVWKRRVHAGDTFQWDDQGTRFPLSKGRPPGNWSTEASVGHLSTHWHADLHATPDTQRDTPSGQTGWGVLFGSVPYRCALPAACAVRTRDVIAPSGPAGGLPHRARTRVTVSLSRGRPRPHELLTDCPRLRQALSLVRDRGNNVGQVRGNAIIHARMPRHCCHSPGLTSRSNLPMPRQYTPRINLTCPKCGGAFSIPPSAQRPGRQVFCSKACSYAGRRVGREIRAYTPTVTRDCDACGKSYTRQPSMIGRYCCVACKQADRRPIADRFWAKVSRTDGCWLWTGKTGNGYGQIRIAGKGSGQVGAHRLSWELHFGPIPDGLFVCHNCPDGDNPLCVRPEHLFLGTHKENMADMAVKGRAASGSRNANRRKALMRQTALVPQTPL